MAEKNIAAFVESLRAAGLDHLSHESVADFLYLAQMWDLFTATPRPQQPPPPPPPVDGAGGVIKPPEAAKKTETPQQKPRLADAPPPIYPAMPGPVQEGTPAARISVADPSALSNPLLIARALRPLARRRLSRRDVELDEEATAEETAESKFVSPVFRPVRERWFDVLLLVEDTVTMTLWQRAIAEFSALLGTQGGFRDVRTAKLRASPEKVEIVEQSGRVAGPASVLAPEGRRLVLVFTHGVSAAWAGGALHGAISAWAARQPVAIVQMLPENSWEHTELGDPGARVRALRPGTPNAAWTVERPEWEVALHPEGVAIPVFSLHYEALGQWAHMVMAEAQAEMPAYFLSEESAAPEPRLTGTADVPANVRVSLFQTNASAEAWQLAVALAASPLQLPIMRLVQQTIFPAKKAEPSQLAELLLGGLMERVYKTDDPERDAFEFHPGVRELLAESMAAGQRYEVRRKVFDYIRSHQETLQLFPALVPHKGGTERLPQWATPFAEEDADFLREVTGGPNAPVFMFSAAVTCLAYLQAGGLAVGLADGWLEVDGKWRRGRGSVLSLQAYRDDVATVWASGEYIGPGTPPAGTKFAIPLGERVAYVTGTAVDFPGYVHAMDSPILCASRLSTSSIVVGLQDGGVLILHSHGVVAAIARMDGPVTAVAGIHENVVAAATANGELLVWVEEPWGPQERRHKFDAPVAAMAWSGGQRLACGVGRDVMLCDFDLGNMVTLGSQSGKVTALAWWTDERLASGSEDATVRVWTFDRRAAVVFWGDHAGLRQALVERGHAIRKSITDDCRAIVWPSDAALPERNVRCLPVVRYGRGDDAAGILRELDAVLAAPPAGSLMDVPEVSADYVPKPEAEAELRKQIQSGASIIVVLDGSQARALDVTCRVARECETRRRFPGGIYGDLTRPVPESDLPVLRIHGPGGLPRLREREQRETWIVAGAQVEGKWFWDAHGAVYVTVEATEEALKESRLNEWCGCRSAVLPAFVVQAIGRTAADEVLVADGVLTFAPDGAVTIDESTHAAHFGKAAPEVHARIAAAMEAEPNSEFSLRERLFHLVRAGRVNEALAVIRDVAWLIPALELGDPGLFNDLHGLGFAELVAELHASGKPVRETLAASKDAGTARAAIRYQRAATYVEVAGTGSHQIPKEAQEAAEAVGLALAQAGFGLITGAWPGVDYVVAAAYLNGGGKSLAHALTKFSSDRFPAALEFDANDSDNPEKLADAVVMIGGLGGTMDIFRAARRLGKPVFPYAPSGGDAKRAVDEMGWSEAGPLKTDLSPQDFAWYVVHQLSTEGGSVGRERMWDLASKYDKIRASMRGGPDRTAAMTQLFYEMVNIAPEAAAHLREFQLSLMPGERLAAVAILQAQPRREELDWLAGMLDNPEREKPFIGFRAATALHRAVAALGPEDVDILEQALDKARTLGEKLTSDPGRLEVLAFAERDLMRKRSERPEEIDVTRLVQQDLGNAILTRNILIFRTSEQRTWITFTTAGVFCSLDNRNKGEDFRIQWRQELDDIAPAGIAAEDRPEQSGLLTIGARRHWLYSRQIWVSETITATMQKELQRAKEFRARAALYRLNDDAVR